CACADLFRVLVDEFDIDVDEYVKKYDPHIAKEFTAYDSDPMIRKSISEFYGIIRGFSIDNIVNDEEIEYIKKWKKENEKYAFIKEIKEITETIDGILLDGKITPDEITKLQSCIKIYLDTVSTSQITLATQILDGILKGIILDKRISNEECKNLRQWLYDNIYLSNHFPFNKTIELVDEVLEDGIITECESEYITNMIKDMLNPVDALHEQINSVKGKKVCLSGDFAYGPKSEVEVYIKNRGGEIDSSLKKATDILMIGDNGSQAYSNGNYGTKVKKAMEYNEKGCNIKIIKESDFFSSIK
ncbi:MAG: BRCT domain-containing protein, partial [Clostridia bacterium]|nr:BRCT domain-containing protein [Clostridia bacterium]